MCTSGPAFKRSPELFLKVNLHLGPFRGEEFPGKRLEADVPSFKSDGVDVHSDRKLVPFLESNLASLPIGS
jgi:hypothetical protein